MAAGDAPESKQRLLTGNVEGGTGATPSERWLEEYGPYLFKYALVRLRNVTWAEDMVQETFLTALKNRGSFAGRSTERTWLVGILKNKIHDFYRKAGRETTFTDLEFYHEEEVEPFVAEGLHRGSWVAELGPADWPLNAGAALDNQAFWKVFEHCSAKLPQKTAAAFALRELDGLSAKEICDAMRISESNLWVMLHRARMALRRCLELNWFGKEGKLAEGR